ncbi:MAG: transporter [Solirubrobacterales bacterium]|nr:transporter [Solirubrobacterales bacterium]
MDSATVSRQHYKMTFWILATGAVSYSLLQSLVLPALPEFQRSLHASETSVSWILTAYLLSASVATPIIGRLGDMYGKERVLVITLAMLGVGTLLSAVATSMGPLLAGRVLQGAGGGIFPLAFGIIRDEFPREKVAGGIGLMSSLLGIGGGAGVIFAGVIVDHLSYHWLFWIPLASIVAATIATWRFVPESPVKVPGRVDWVSAFLMSSGLVIVLVAVSQTTTWGWGSGRVWGLIAFGTLLLVAWVRNEIRSDEPLVDMSMMRIRGVWTTNTVAFLLGVGMYSSFILIPQYVQEPTGTGYGFGVSIIASGLFLLPSTVAMVLVGQFAGRLEHRFGSKPPLLAGAGFAAAAFLLLVSVRDQRWEIYVSSVLLGIGIGLAFAALANLIVANVRQEQTGVATGMNTVMRTLGGALGGQVAATFLANSLVAGHPTNHAFTLAFALCAGALVIGIVAGLAIPGRPTRTSVAGAAVPETSG